MDHGPHEFGTSAASGETSKELLGGKGSNLAKMASLGYPVPPGFTLTTEACAEYQQLSPAGRKKLVEDLLNASVPFFTRLEETLGYQPLMSVRSGAPVSMPGMMDTILNVGLDEHTLPGWVARIGKLAALDSYRRLIQMFANVVHGIPVELFEELLESVKGYQGATPDSELHAESMEAVVAGYKALYRDLMDEDFPTAGFPQLVPAVSAVFESWGNDRAVAYREAHGIDPSMGTAVNVQTMVFGNMNDHSGSGVLFTRCPNSGAAGVMGEFLPNAQGEDVVAGVRTPLPLHKMNDLMPGAYKELMNMVLGLENHYRDMQDVEFTIQDGTVYLLQTRTGKRSALAAFQTARDLVHEEVITRKEALERVSSKQYMTLLRPRIDPAYTGKPDYVGLGAAGSIVSGKCVHTAEEAVKMNEATILVSKETTPDDFSGMMASEGILTTTGGLTSHAAVVARSMDKTCVVGCADLDPSKIKKGAKLTIDGLTGRVWVGKDVPVLVGVVPPVADEVLGWGKKPKPAMELIGQDDVKAVDPGEVCVKVNSVYPNIYIARDTVGPVVAALKERRKELYGVIDLRSEEEADVLTGADKEFCTAMGTDPDTVFTGPKNNGFEGVMQALTWKKWGTEVRQRFAIILPEDATEEHALMLESAGWCVVREADTFGALVTLGAKKKKIYCIVGKGLKARLKQEELTLKSALKLLSDAGRDVSVLPTPRALRDRVIEVLGA